VIVTEFITALGLDSPLTFIALFLAASLIMIWRLEAMGKHGLEGTAIGTLITPYCSGLGNLIFVYLVLRDNGSGQDVMTNCLVNNVTNLTLLLGVPAMFGALTIIPEARPTNGKKPKPRGKNGNKAETERKLSRLSLLLTMAAVAFFTGAVWALGRDGSLDFSDGLVLVGLFLFWQCFQVFDVLKQNVRQNRGFSFWFYLDLLSVVVGAWILYESLDWLVAWMMTQRSGFVSADNLGWLSGWLMVLPNAVLALYYAAKNRGDIVYASQIGDGHICIPLCIGLFAMVKPLHLPPVFEASIWILAGSLAVHFVFLVAFGRLPKFVGAALVIAYSFFVYKGILD
jgi:cation:H+ antiporter